MSKDPLAVRPLLAQYFFPRFADSYALHSEFDSTPAVLPRNQWFLICKCITIGSSHNALRKILSAKISASGFGDRFKDLNRTLREHVHNNGCSGSPNGTVPASREAGIDREPRLHNQLRLY